MNLLDAFNLEEKRAKKLDSKDLRELCESIMIEKAKPASEPILENWKKLAGLL